MTSISGILRALATGAALVGTLLASNASALPPATSVEATSGADECPLSTVVQAMTDELARSAQLSLPGAAKPYFVAYLIHDLHSRQMLASNGTLVKSDERHFRLGAAQVRLGDYQFDNSNFTGAPPLTAFSPLPIDRDYDSVRRSLWLLSDQAYKRSVMGFEAKKAAKQTWAESPDDVGDFSREAPVRIVVDPPPPLHHEAFESLVRNVSKVFREYPIIQTNRVTASLVSYRRTFVSTEGATFVEPRTTAIVGLSCSAQADDGMLLHNYAVATSVDGVAVPQQSELVAEAHRIAQELDQIRAAPVVDDFVGPVLFAGEAAGQLLIRVLERELSGTPPPKPAARSQSELFQRLGQRVMPKGLRLVDDPQLKTHGKVPLLGAYRVDNEGVPGQKVLLVDNGILKNLLMTRAPRKGCAKSNGHARRFLPGRGGASPGNLILTGSGRIVARDMRKRLLAEVRRAKAPYGLVVRLLPEWIDREAPSMSDAAPAMLRVLPDGTEQVVRGASDLEGLDLRMLERIVAVGQTAAVHNCVQLNALDPPLSAVSPALLIEKVVVKKREGPEPRPPLVPRPPVN